MTVTPEQLAAWRTVCEKATPGPWEAEVDLLGNDEWEAIVADAGTSIMFTAGTGVSMYHGDDRAWTAEDSHLRDERCAQAKASQSMLDAAFIATARSALPALLDEVERYGTALTKISAIRDSIVGKQGFLSNLASNLAVAGALMIAGLYAELRITRGVDWFPGCGRVAPGWEIP